MSKNNGDVGTLYLSYEESRTGGGISPGQENEKWPDYEDEIIEWSLTGCYADPNNCPWLRQEVKVDFVPVAGQDVWVTYVRFSCYDTFSWMEGCWMILGVYATEKEAYDQKKLVNEEKHP